MHEETARLRARVASAVGGMSAAETQTTPRKHPEKWSTQQIVEHLRLSYRATCEVMTVRLAKGTPTRAQPTLLQRLAKFSILNVGYFPAGLPAPAAVTPPLPAVSASGVELSALVEADLTEMDGLITRSEVLFGQRAAVSHIRLGPLTAQQWRRFHLVHGLHHARQIDRLRGQRA